MQTKSEKISKSFFMLLSGMCVGGEEVIAYNLAQKVKGQWQEIFCTGVLISTYRCERERNTVCSAFHKKSELVVLLS
jgi:hypothetical protein